MTMTSTDQPVASPLTRGRSTELDRGHPTPSGYRPITDAPEQCETPAERRASAPGTTLHNPVRISRIGGNHLQVFIRPVDGCRELAVLIDRLEQLIGAGYEVIDVVFEPTHLAGSSRHDELSARSDCRRLAQDRV